MKLIYNEATSFDDQKVKESLDDLGIQKGESGGRGALESIKFL